MQSVFTTTALALVLANAYASPGAAYIQKLSRGELKNDSRIGQTDSP